MKIKGVNVTVLERRINFYGKTVSGLLMDYGQSHG